MGCVYTHEEPHGEISKCRKCGFEASSTYLVRGLCESCRCWRDSRGPGKPWGSSGPKMAGIHQVLARAARRGLTVPESLKLLLLEQREVPESDLPAELRRLDEFAGKKRLQARR